MVLEVKLVSNVKMSDQIPAPKPLSELPKIGAVGFSNIKL